MLTMNDLNPLLRRHRAVVTRSGDKVGAIGVVFLDDATDEPTWVTVHTGLFGTRESFVPLAGAEVQGDQLVVDYPRDVIKHAPSTERDGHLSPEDELGLYRHYGLIRPEAATTTVPVTAAATETATTTGRDEATTTVPVTAAAPETATGTGRDAATTTVPATNRDEAVRGGRDGGEPWMVRSEEQLRIRTEPYEAARVRLRKYVVTEEAVQTVPLSREELRIEREPITGAIGDPTAGDSLFQEEVVEMVGREERAVVSKETVAVERVQLRKATVEGRATVTEQVRKERIATNVPDIPAARGTTAGTRGPAGGTAGDSSGTASRRATGRRADTADDGSARIPTNSRNAIIKGTKKRR
ncbi:PRC and DUF2382 domain-containing protein [Arthrobacter sedimenti]|uniref:PRC and DUF2382 domain-containing protein n=1 Tax=Arthrobacter sedimenti TaxID=2694931 RepID=UPI000B351FF6|nr:PRC and DUF2382 domain-containing protein [Arthrobacter sedimenti]OUM43524.1 hypothetical protein B8W73_05215 [Arthrobacter agilis]